MGREWHLCSGSELLGKEVEGRFLNQTMAWTRMQERGQTLESRTAPFLTQISDDILIVINKMLIVQLFEKLA